MCLEKFRLFLFKFFSLGIVVVLFLIAVLQLNMIEKEDI